MDNQQTEGKPEQSASGDLFSSAYERVDNSVRAVRNSRAAAGVLSKLFSGATKKAAVGLLSPTGILLIVFGFLLLFMVLLPLFMATNESIGPGPYNAQQ